MSEEGASFWITLTEKVIGIVLTILGVLMIYFTTTSGAVLSIFTGFFTFLSVIVLVGGVFLMITKPPE